MLVEELRDMRERLPFRPFTIHMQSGRTHFIKHRDYLLISPVGDPVLVYRDGGGFSFVDAETIKEISYDPPAPQANPAAEAAA